MAASQINSFAFIFSFIVAILATFGLSEVKGNAFIVDMFHRDSPDSPFYKQLETHYEQLAAAFSRSINRAQRFNTALSVPLDSAEALVTSKSGEYLVKISLGSQPFSISTIVDTSSDLIWTQCEPCEQCYKQTAPIFDPRKSKTYRKISCQSNIYGEIGGTSCSGSSARGYSVSYGAAIKTNGVMLPLPNNLLFKVKSLVCRATFERQRGSS